MNKKCKHCGAEDGSRRCDGTTVRFDGSIRTLSCTVCHREIRNRSIKAKKDRDAMNAVGSGWYKPFGATNLVPTP